ncbi:benzoate-CoA ligase family protein [Microvirga massiliensis]|uniref:benzoate-CoA ligase family protein n=1 Tax=Microvirga massiliensis TaxID=1033741 RepID=UPI0009E3AE59|nr:benzoate-CoA ligase family protein [Microvirga massiliensis]
MARTAHVDTFVRDNLPPKEQWPQFIFSLPELQYPERLNCVSAFLDRWVEEGRGDEPCLVTPQETLSYRELQERVDRICHVLVNQLGLVTGGRVLLRSANNAMLVATYLAVLKAGGIVVATMPLLRAKELAQLVRKARIGLALCDHRLLEELERAVSLAPELKGVVAWGSGQGGDLEGLMSQVSGPFPAVDTAAGDACLIAFTSGTTGEPKGTVHFHRDLLAICDSYSHHVLRARPEDRFIGSPPLAFTFGLGGIVLFPMRIGASAVLLEKGAPDDLLAAIARYRASVCFTAPTAYRAMLTKLQDHDVSSLRKCVSAGETLPKATFDAFFQATGLRLMDGIGATEMLHIFIAAREEDIRLGATGKPVPGYEAKIIDETGRELPPGAIGRLVVRGPTGCRYLNDERQRRYVENGWNVTGDTYIMDEDGYFWYQARSDDMIVSSGYNIAGPEVEAALLTHEAVAECGVVGVPDSERGMIVKAYVVLQAGHSPGGDLVKAIQEHVKAEIAPYKYPRVIDFVDALPRTPTGKLQRFELRRIALEQAAAANAAAAE